MSKLPVLMSMSRLNFTHCHPIFSLLKNFKIFNHTLNYNAVFPSSFNRFSSINRPLFNCNDFTPFFCTSAASDYADLSSPSPEKNPQKSSRRRRKNSGPENVLRHQLDMCSKNNNLASAIHLYNCAIKDGITLSIRHYNSLLYLCALSASSDDDSSGSGTSSSSIDALEKGFEIFRQMGIDKVDPNEATFTSLARLAAAKEDPKMAFDFIKQMKDSGMSPKLRSYGPALFGFCDQGDADGAYEVDAHMVECGVVAEEVELCALLKVSVDARREDKVYEILHRLRACVRQVSEETAGVVEEWFTSETASGVGVEEWDTSKVKQGVIKGGGGWHGQGWLGSGKWRVVKAEIDKTGVCSCCGEKLVCIDIDPKETESFARSLSSLACEKEKRADFLQFQEWLKTRGPFEAVVDGANVAMIQTHTFRFRQLINIVKHLQNNSPSKRLPLVILHKKHVHGVEAEHPNTKRFLDTLRKAGALYATPRGSNDDWYWLYAAVYCKCLLVTNDEMRDHLFQLLGDSIFPRWKEKHQVRMTVSVSGLDLHMPPPYSSVIQESERGSWHIPTVTGDDLEMPRQWLCATRGTPTRSMVGAPVQISNIHLRD